MIARVDVRKAMLCLLVALSAQPTSTARDEVGVVPADRRTVWAPGIPGGVPQRTKICGAVNAAAFGDGVRDASAAIQSAIAACPVGQVVQLSAGQFTVNNYVIINKGITLRGAGPGATILEKTNGAKPNSYKVADAQPVVIIGTTRWPAMDNRHSQNLVADAGHGADSVAVASGGQFAAGQFVLLDEDDYSAASWRTLPNRGGVPTTARIWASDRAVFMRHDPSDRADDPFPESLSWFSRSGRPINEIKEIASVTGKRVTFTTPLHINYSVAKSAQLTPIGGGSLVKQAGLEDLTVSGGGDGNVRFEAAAYSWVKNIEDTAWLGEGLALNYAFRCEIRDSYIHDGVWPEPGGGGYALSSAAGSSEWLVENNIVRQANKMIVVRSSGAGSVVGYNYMDDGLIRSDPSWIEVGINASHMVGSHHVLFEGNESFNYDSDNTHGNAIYMTVFRNHLTGVRRDYPGLRNARAVGLMYGSWWHSFVGNVMGTPAAVRGWTYEAAGHEPTSGGGSGWDRAGYVWKLGYDPTHWAQSADPQVLSTTLRDGNFDFLTNQVRWEHAPQAIPPSLYLTGKPAFFGSAQWPWVDPTGTTKLYTLPARERYEAMIRQGSPSHPPIK